MSFPFKNLPHPGIRSLTPYKPGKSIEELVKETGLSDVIKMASNENPLGCSPLALAALRSMSPKLIATYPSPINHALMPKLAAHLKVKAEQLFLSNGSDYLFGILLNCFALHLDKHILTHDYAFSTYGIQAHSLNIPVKTVPIESNWEVNIENLIKACNSKTSIIFLANPNNPTGLLTSQDKMKYLLENIPESTLLVIDEAYFEFAAPLLSSNSIEWLEQHPNLVVTRTFSKIYGLAGLRLGYAIAHPDIIDVLKRVQLPFAVNQAALAAACAGLDDEGFINLTLENNAAGMKQIREGLVKLKLNYIPSVCNFITFDCKDDGMNLYNFLLGKGIIIRPLHPYKMNNYLRVTIGTKDQNSRFLSALEQWL